MIIILLILGTLHIGPRVEQKFFPVVGPHVILEWEPVGETQTCVWVTINKFRACGFLGVDFFLAGDTIDRVISRVDVPATTYNPPGVLTFGPAVLSATKEQIRSGAIAVASHRCHAIWDTITVAKVVFSPILAEHETDPMGHHAGNQPPRGTSP